MKKLEEKLEPGAQVVKEKAEVDRETAVYSDARNRKKREHSPMKSSVAWSPKGKR